MPLMALGTRRLLTALLMGALLVVLMRRMAQWGSERDGRAGLAQERLLALSLDVQRVGAEPGRRRIAAAIQRRREAGVAVVPADYFSPYWDGPLPLASAYAFASAASLTDAEVDRLTSYEVPVAACCEGCGWAARPVLADRLAPFGMLVVMSDGKVRLVGSVASGDPAAPSDAELLRCFTVSR